MAEVLTKQQEQAVFDRGGKLLVSAAAGSGKTKVLVDRIMSYIKDPISPVNVDEFLIITFTKAAAAELRGKIAAKLSEEIAEDPANRHLQRQMQRLYLAKISTVHAYCADILRENAFYLDIPSDFRMAEENESDELQSAVIDKVLDEAYKDIHNDNELSMFVDTQGYGRNDRQLSEIILKLYKNSRCHMDPNGWLDWCVEVFNTAKINDLTDTLWAKYLIDDLHRYIDLQIKALESCAENAKDAEGMAKPVALFYDTIDQLRVLRKCNKWDQIVNNANIEFGSLTFPRKDFDAEMADKMKIIRNSCKTGILSKLRRFTDCGDQILADISETASAARALVMLTKRFADAYEKAKKRLRVLDFGDLEQKTLDLLMGKNRRAPTLLAHEIGNRFCEVMVDEYQDTNEVQDAIFFALTEKRQNCFMVGDVKQSIYQFRRADPGIFLDKYNAYKPAENAEPGEPRKVLLTNNFRSSGEVIDAVNHVFAACMSKGVGGLDYGADEMLYEGFPHENLGEPDVELYGIVSEEDAYDTEAEFVAQRVVALLNGKHMVRDKSGLRSIKPTDIAILLRSPGSTGVRYMEALNRAGINCWFGNSVNLLETEEVQAVCSMLRVLDNPLQDIPLISLLTSKLFRFTSDDLALIRCAKKDCCFFEALKADTSEKSKQFVSLLRSLRLKARTSTLLGLIKYIFALTKVDSIFAAMPDGVSKTENLLGFYKIVADFEARGGSSISSFLARLDNLEKKGISIDTDKAGIDAVTITSIHKSKGLEYPVVILPGLSRKFNTDSAYENLLCDKDLGIGLSCVDIKNKIRYPSVSKHAISAKILADGLSEEMRILYVAMTRARDRLIMTYTSSKLEKVLYETAVRMEYSPKELLTSDVGCIGDWVLISAMQRSDADDFFAISSRPKVTDVCKSSWVIKIIDKNITAGKAGLTETVEHRGLSEYARLKLERTLMYQYPFSAATTVPSKETATQLKGRTKDEEVAESTHLKESYSKYFRKPSFVDNQGSVFSRGNAYHTVMQYISYSECTSCSGIEKEIDRLVCDGYLNADQAKIVDTNKIFSFFNTDFGKDLIESKNVLREFKFSVLEDAGQYDSAICGEEILLQGVVDCALIEDDGITIIDFKSDRIAPNQVDSTAENYKLQVMAYANAMSRIFSKPIKRIALYFFEPEMIFTF